MLRVPQLAVALHVLINASSTLPMPEGSSPKKAPTLNSKPGTPGLEKAPIRGEGEGGGGDEGQRQGPVFRTSGRRFVEFQLKIMRLIPKP